MASPDDWLTEPLTPDLLAELRADLTRLTRIKKRHWPFKGTREVPSTTVGLRRETCVRLIDEIERLREESA